MESACETPVPRSWEKRWGVMVQTWGNLSAVLRKGQLWMVTFTPSAVSVCSARVPARPIQATTRASFSSNSKPSRVGAMTVAWGHALEDLVQRRRPAHALDLLQHHRSQLAVPLREDGDGALGE